jgi:murein DD-endopeptidase MepM/ murein hydrolase activator NlpD
VRGLLSLVLGAICGAVGLYVLMQQQAAALERPGSGSAVAVAAAAQIPSTPGKSASIPVRATSAPPGTTVPATASASPTPTQTAESPPGSATTRASLKPGATQPLLIPVDGVSAHQLTDTFDTARAAGRRHDAIDIMAPKGTRVFAAADGSVVKLFTSVRGGLTMYEFDPGATVEYYYAHLDSYAPGLSEGQTLRRGDLVGFVGSTGDADPGAPHLHFEIAVLGPEKHWWHATDINPYPILTGRQELAAAVDAATASLPGK